MDVGGAGKLLLLLGAMIMLAGGALLLLERVPGLGHLPGDISVRRDGVTFIFPLAASILLSLILTAVLNLALRWFNR